MDEETKIKHSTRLLQKEKYVAKQLKIAKVYNIPVKDKHRLQDHAAVNCGNPDCLLCSNPRKVWGKKTIQEKKFDQTFNWE